MDDQLRSLGRSVAELGSALGVRVVDRIEHCTSVGVPYAGLAGQSLSCPGEGGPPA